LTGTGGIIYYNGGNVGIGTSTNIANFQIYGASNPNITLGNSTYTSDFQIGMASAGGNYSSSAIAGDTIIRTISGNLMLQAMGGGAAAIYLSRTNNYVGIGTITPSNLLTVAQLGTNYTSPVVVVDAGIPSNATAGAPRGIGKPLLGIGNSSWTSGGVAGDYYGIGFGYGGAASGSYYPAEIGLFVQTTSGATWGDIVFSARGVTSATVAVERMRITGAGNVGIGISSPPHRLTIFQDGNSLLNEGATHSMSIISNQGTAGVDQMFMMLDADHTNQCCSIQSIVNALRVWNLCLNPRGGNVGVGTTAPIGMLDVRGTIGASAPWTTPVFNVYGGTAFDASNIVNFQCQASAYGRNILYMTGRYETDNDAWSFVSPRNAIIFQTQSALNSAATQRFTIQNYASQLGILSSGKPNTYPITVWNDNGNVGIGISNPTYLLHISSISNTYTLAGFLGSGGVGAWGGGSIENATSLFITGWGMTQAAWGVTSDRRVKTNIEPVSNMLSIIRQVNVVKYDYIDPRLGREECSVIAQELQAVFPNAINVTTDYVPNIFKRCSHVQQDDVVTLSVTLESTPEHLAAITVGATLKMMISDDDGETEREITTPILAVSFTDHMIQVSVWDKYMDTSIVYVYGTEVKDYLSVDKPQLGVMALQGVKELMSENEQLKSQVAALQAANAATSSQMAALLVWARTQGFS
jgi:hypothetical protein